MSDNGTRTRIRVTCRIVGQPEVNVFYHSRSRGLRRSWFYCLESSTHLAHGNLTANGLVAALNEWSAYRPSFRSVLVKENTGFPGRPPRALTSDQTTNSTSDPVPLAGRPPTRQKFRLSQVLFGQAPRVTRSCGISTISRSFLKGDCSISLTFSRKQTLVQAGTPRYTGSTPQYCTSVQYQSS